MRHSYSARNFRFVLISILDRRRLFQKSRTPTKTYQRYSVHTRLRFWGVCKNYRAHSRPGLFENSQSARNFHHQKLQRCRCNKFEQWRPTERDCQRFSSTKCPNWEEISPNLSGSFVQKCESGNGVRPPLLCPRRLEWFQGGNAHHCRLPCVNFTPFRLLRYLFYHAKMQ